jgi:hypothetical protein
MNNRYLPSFTKTAKATYQIYEEQILDDLIIRYIFTFNNSPQKPTAVFHVRADLAEDGL